MLTSTGINQSCFTLQEPKTDCGLMPVQICYHPKEICKTSENCIPLTQPRCFTVLKDTCLNKDANTVGPKSQNCQLIPDKTDCKNVTIKSCKEIKIFETKTVPVCKEVTEEKCSPSQVNECNLVPETVCSVIEKSPPLKITKCETVIEAQCEVVVKQDCQTSPKSTQDCQTVCNYENKIVCQIQEDNCSKTKVQVEVCADPRIQFG